MEVKFIVFGKEDCDLCKHRMEFLEGFAKKHHKVDSSTSFCCEYRDATDPMTMTDMAMMGIGDIPSVVMLVGDNEDPVMKWNGPKEYPTTRSLLDAMESIKVS